MSSPYVVFPLPGGTGDSTTVTAELAPMSAQVVSLFLDILSALHCARRTRGIDQLRLE